MAMSDERTKRDLILSPGTYAYMRDTATGGIKTATGPTVINPTAQEEPVIYDPGIASFKRVGLDEVSRKSVIAPEGYYVILLNPSISDSVAHPMNGKTQGSVELDVGRKVIIPGPTMFPLWPGQAADVVRGHQIRFNQYLIARVYNEEQATQNWQSAVMKPAKVDKITSEGTTEESDAPPDLAVGTLLIIRGDEVSFYIPPTGITVQKAANGEYVQDALTLERLEYAILVGQDGNKRYEKGPLVVFPSPSERFVEARDDNGNPSTKFRAVELNYLQGLHIKVIANYEENGSKHEAGDELFITGRDTAIYYPREEHSAIKYDGIAKHFATAVPAGEARYVMNRETGAITTFRGPGMLLPDPRKEVIVRRTLTELQADLWYPDNQEVAEYNAHLRKLLSLVPTTRQGAISEGDYARNTRGAKKLEASTKGGIGALEATRSAILSNAAPTQMERSRVSGDQDLVGDEFSRKSTYSQPRSIDLNTKFQGAPRIKVYTGYAIQVVATTGTRAVLKGPQTILLGYDQELEGIILSQGKPKTTDKILKTVYLRVDNNKVSDVVEVETSDHVKIHLHVSYNINFEGDDKIWFSVENYVQFACHHARSVLQGAILKVGFNDFYMHSRDIIRDVILGKSTTSDAKTDIKSTSLRPGMVFKENGMRIGEVDITRVEILDQRIRDFIAAAQFDAVKSNIDLSTKTRELAVLEQSEKLIQAINAVKADTRKRTDLMEVDLLQSKLAVLLTEADNRLKALGKDSIIQQAVDDIANTKQRAALDRQKQQSDLEHSKQTATQELLLASLEAETKALTARFTAAVPGFAEALTALGNKDTLIKVAEAWSIQRAIGGENVSDAIRRIFSGTTIQGVMEKILASNVPANGSPKYVGGLDTPTKS